MYVKKAHYNPFTRRYQYAGMDGDTSPVSKQARLLGETFYALRANPTACAGILKDHGYAPTTGSMKEKRQFVLSKLREKNPDVIDIAFAERIVALTKKERDKLQERMSKASRSSGFQLGSLLRGKQKADLMKDYAEVRKEELKKPVAESKASYEGASPEASELITAVQTIPDEELDGVVEVAVAQAEADQKVATAQKAGVASSLLPVVVIGLGIVLLVKASK